MSLRKIDYETYPVVTHVVDGRDKSRLHLILYGKAPIFIGGHVFQLNDREISYFLRTAVTRDGLMVAKVVAGDEEGFLQSAEVLSLRLGQVGVLYHDKPDQDSGYPRLVLSNRVRPVKEMAHYSRVVTSIFGDPEVPWKRVRRRL